MNVPNLKPKWAGQYDTFDDWVANASRTIAAPYCPTDGVGHALPAVCVDSLGRRCAVGADFMRARDGGAFPVYYFWACEIGDEVVSVPLAEAGKDPVNVTEMLRRLPIMGTLNIDTNKFTPNKDATHEPQ